MYRYRDPSGRHWDINPRAILHFRMGIDPDMTMRGISPLAYCVEEIATDNLSSLYSASILKNLGAASHLFSPKPNAEGAYPTGNQIKEFRDAFEALTQSEGAGRAAIATVPVEVTELSVTPEKMALDSMRDVPVQRICAAFGVDPMVLGLSSANKTYSNLAEAQDAAWFNCVLPIKKILALELQRQLLGYWFDGLDLVIGIDTSEVKALQDDEDALWQRLSNAYMNGWITRADARERAGLEVEKGRDDVFQDEASSGTTPQDKATAKMAAMVAKGRRVMAEDPDGDPED
jgi:HK97 family phage portal protein